MSDDPPFGTYAPNAYQRALMAYTHSLPEAAAKHLAAPARALLLASIAGPIDAEPYGFKARLYPHDNLTDKRALVTPQCFDPRERAALAEHITPDFTFIDAGANTGLYSLFVALRAGPGARILAIEPQPGVKERLRCNIALNGFSQIAHADTALAEGRGEARLSAPEKNRGEATIVDTTDGVVVPTIGLFELMDEHGIARADALKIDIEGAEDRVLPPFFERCPGERLPRLLVMETLSRSWRVDCVALAKAAGYQTKVDTGRNLVLARD